MKKVIFLVVIFIFLFPDITFGKNLYWKSLKASLSIISSSKNYNPIKGIEVDPINPSLVYVATWGNGVLKSTDGGKHFEPINNGLSEVNTYVVKVDPKNPKTLYVGTATGIFISNDLGKSFNLLGNFRLAVTSIEFGDGVIYAGIYNEGVNAGLYKFKNSEWSAIGLSDKDVLSIARLNSSTLLLGTSDGLYSFDEKTSSFKFLSFQDLTVNAIAISEKKIVIETSDGVYASDLDPIYFFTLENFSPKLKEGNFFSAFFYRDNPQRVLLGKSDGSLYRIDFDKGTFEILKLKAKAVYSIYITVKGTIFVGSENALLWSENDGKSFKGFNLSISGGEMQINPNNPNIIFVGSNNGLYKSENGGISFINIGFEGERVFSIALNPSNNQEIFVGTYLGLYRSNDSGDSFDEIKDFSGLSVTKVVISPQSGTIFAGTEDGVFVSKDRGITWEKSLSIKDGDFVIDIALDPSSSDTIYAATFIDGLYKSVDGGLSWKYLGGQELIISSISVCNANPNVIYLSTLGSIYLSNDEGKTFSKKFNITSSIGSEYIFKQVAVNPNNPNKAYAIGDFVTYGINRVTGLPETVYDEPILYMTVNGGETWSKLDLPNTIESNNAIYYDSKTDTALLLTGIGILHYDFSNMTYWFYSEGLVEDYIRVVRYFDNTLFVGTSSGNIARSSDGGKTFKFHAKYDVPILALFQSPSNPNRIYAGTSIGLLVSDNFGSTWRRFFSGEVYAITGFTFQGADVLFLGTDTGITELIGSLDSPKQIYEGICTALYYKGEVLYAGTDKGLLASKDLTNFYVLNEITSTINRIEIFDDSLLVGTNAGLYVIANDSINSLLDDSIIFDMANVNGTIYLATDSGVLILNKDLSYTSLNNGLTSYYATSITCDNNGRIYLGTDGGGLFKLETVSTLKVSSSRGGKIEPNGSIEITPDEAKEFLIKPDIGFKIKDVLLNGDSCLNMLKDLGGGNFSLTISHISDDSTLYVNFEPISFKIISSSSESGTISPSGTITVNYGDSKTFTITPNTGYKIKDVQVDGISVGAVSSYTFSNITSNHTIEASFEKLITQTIIILQIGSSIFTVNGSPRTLDSPPIIKNGRTLLPIRAVVEALNGTVSWDETQKKVTVSLGNNTIELWIGKSSALVNGIDTPIDPANPKVVPEIINGRTMLPLRFVAENLGCSVEWDSATKTITLTYQGG